MSVLNRIAHFQQRRDEIPNQELARDLAAKKDKAGIREIAEHLWDKNKNVQADCIKVLYEIGYMNPALIAGYAEDFIKLLKSKNNRLVWGGMTALAMIIGMVPMALAVGEAGEQNAPLGRAVIGGLLVATGTTLFVVPVIYSLLRRKVPSRHLLDERFLAEERGEMLPES